MLPESVRESVVPIRLSDYRPPPHLIDEISLDVDLGQDGATVTSVMHGRRNPASDQPKAALHLDGCAQELLEIVVDGNILNPDAYVLAPDSLVIPGVAERFAITIKSLNRPQDNTALEGLYLSNGMYCTQCEAEGFRRITYYPDRPDVMAVFTTTIRADKAEYPVLLSNGNPVSAGDLDDGRHFATWHDPFPKPSYLFAMVAGDLASVEDRFTTRSGRTVKLRIFVEHGDESRCGHAMAALKRAMAWDEDRFGLEYDLDLFMIVAVSHFNMGAMENKGLNIFNSRYVLANRETATDIDFQRIEEIVAHEYFHNWTGNRVTCRDWFQLSLKEGLTVFRDQEFKADTQSRGVKRVIDAGFVRSVQFEEDAGPSAHPVRPSEYLEINNFYTVTIYEKGAEIVRMIHTRLGEEGFRKGMDLYFERHDGMAATCDDFVAAMQEATGTDLSDMQAWYDQAGTAELTIALDHDPQRQQATLHVTQTVPATPQQKDKQPMPIPLALGLLDPDGKELPLRLVGEMANEAPSSRILMIDRACQSFTFETVPSRPVPSLLRGFSAPVKIRAERTPDDLKLLMENDSDPFARWDAGQTLATRLLLDLVAAYRNGKPMVLDARFAASVRINLGDVQLEPAVRAQMLELPGEGDLALAMDIADVDAIHAARTFMIQALGTTLHDDLLATHDACMARQTASDLSTEAMGLRVLGNAALGYLALSGRLEGRKLAKRQFDAAASMTTVMGALNALNDVDCDERTAALAAFHDRWRDRPMELDKWFALTAGSSLPGTLDTVKGLLQHPAFDLKTPNRVRAVAGTFTARNPVRFHAPDGAGYRFLADMVLKLDPVNPQIAARLLSPLVRWRRYDRPRRVLMIEQLKRIAATDSLSKNATEITRQGLAESDPT